MTFGRELVDHGGELAGRWYRAWRESRHPHRQATETELKDKIPQQLRVLGEQLRDPTFAEDPSQMWKVTERLDPELRVAERIPIEDLVLGYKILVNVIRSWISERAIEVSFAEYSYFYDAVFELVAESVRRYESFRAAQVARERSEYLAGIAHQMRSPLSALALSVHVLERRAPSLDRVIIDRIRRSVRRLQGLVDGVLRLERFTPEELPVKAQEIDCFRLATEIVSDREHEASRKGLRVEVDVPRELRMIADPDLLRDAVDNLVDNAIKYTPSGVVEVSARAEDPDRVVFAVEDSGPGIRPERRGELFAPVESERSGGTGIGLVVVQRAVAAQHGEVGVDSEPGEGARFWFRLPRDVTALGAGDGSAG